VCRFVKSWYRKCSNLTLLDETPVYLWCTPKPRIDRFQLISASIKIIKLLVFNVAMQSDSRRLHHIILFSIIYVLYCTEICAMLWVSFADRPLPAMQICSAPQRHRANGRALPAIRKSSDPSHKPTDRNQLDFYNRTLGFLSIRRASWRTLWRFPLQGGWALWFSSVSPSASTLRIRFESNLGVDKTSWENQC